MVKFSLSINYSKTCKELTKIDLLTCSKSPSTFNYQPRPGQNVPGTKDITRVIVLRMRNTAILEHTQEAQRDLFRYEVTSTSTASTNTNFDTKFERKLVSWYLKFN